MGNIYNKEIREQQINRSIYRSHSEGGKERGRERETRKGEKNNTTTIDQERKT